MAVQLSLKGKNKDLKQFVTEHEIEQYVESSELNADDTAEYIMTNCAAVMKAVNGIEKRDIVVTPLDDFQGIPRKD